MAVPRRVRRSPLVFWLLVAVLAALTALTTARLLSHAAAAAARYGRERPVLTVTRTVEAGEELAAADVGLRRMPASFVPEGAVAVAAQAVGRTVVVPIFPGEPVLRAHLAPTGLRGMAALLPFGARAVAVPTGSSSVPLRRGDRVDVLATFDPDSRPAEPGTPPVEPTFPVATAALVLEAGPESAVVAVDLEEAKRVAFAVAHGIVTLAVTAGPVDVTFSEDPPPGP